MGKTKLTQRWNLSLLTKIGKVLYPKNLAIYYACPIFTNQLNAYQNLAPHPMPAPELKGPGRLLYD